MRLSASALQALHELGVPKDRLLEAAQLIEADLASPARSKAAERQARYRERKKAAGNESITSDVTDDATCDVTDDVTCDAEPQCDATSDVTRYVTGDLSPRTPLSDIYYLVISARTREERLALQSQIRRERFREVLDEVKVRLNGSADWTKLAVQHANPLIQLIAPAEGEPCSIEDVYAAAEETGRQFHAKGKPLTNWGYLRTVALSFRDARLRPAPEVEIIDEPATSDSSASGGGRQPVEDRQRSQRQPQRDTLFAATMRYHDRVSHE